MSYWYVKLHNAWKSVLRSEVPYACICTVARILKNTLRRKEAFAEEIRLFCLHIVGKIVFFLYMSFESMRYFVKVLFSDAADETLGLQVLLHLLQLVSKFAKSVDDETWGRRKRYSFEE